VLARGAGLMQSYSTLAAIYSGSIHWLQFTCTAEFMSRTQFRLNLWGWGAQ